MKDTNGENKTALRKKISLLTGKDFWNTQEYPEINARSIKFSDGPHGIRVQSKKSDNFGLNSSEKATCFAEMSSAACSWDEEILYGTGARLGREAAFFGVNVLLGPSVNIKRNPLGGRNFEYFSEDPYLTGRLASAYIKGVQLSNVSACVKHYAANNREFARTVCDSVLSDTALREIYLQPFEMCVKGGGAGAVMTAYNKLNGVHCSQNKRLISDILRGEWGFDGITVSDWVGTYDRVEGVKAGEDIEMPCCPLTYEEVEKAASDGRLTEEEIDNCVGRIAKFSNTWRPKAAQCDFGEHSDFVRRSAEGSIVLLKNNGILPLKPKTRAAVVGAVGVRTALQGGGSARVNGKYSDGVLPALKSKFEITGYESGYKLSGKYSKKLLKRALKLAKGVDTVICFVGLTDKQECEGADKKSISLPRCQTELVKALVKAGKKVIAVLASGSAVDTSWDKGVCALVQAGFYGQNGGKALASILCGEVNPSGKLAESYPISYDDLPCAKTFGSDPYMEEYTEDVFVGYRWFDSTGISPKYPFGYGLSYTTFEYSDIAADGSGVSFTIKNTGKTDGAEVAEVYISRPECGHALPEKALKGFKKVFIEAGESVGVYIPFDGYAFRTYDEMSDSWRIYAGEYHISVGASSQDIRLKCAIHMDGDMPEHRDGVEKRNHILAAAKNAQPKETEKRSGRTEVTLQTPFAELRRARGAGGRFLYRTATAWCSHRKDPSLQTLTHLYMRSIAQYARFNGAQAQGLLLVCNGHFFKGIKKIIFKR